MLNTSYLYVLHFLPFFIIFISVFITIIINYLNSVKNVIFSKNKKKKNGLANMETYFINVSNFNLFFFLVSYLIFNFKRYQPQNNLNIFDNKICIFYFLYFLFIMTTYLLNKYHLPQKKLLNYNSYISIFFLIIVYFILYISDFFLFFFVVELLSYIFYFQFLQIFNKLKTNNKKNYYMDSLLMFYWVNFFGSIFLFFSIIAIFYNFGTSNYKELSFFSGYSYKFTIFIFFFLLGFSIKLGVSGFHFLKIEVYKNLKIDSIINFSFLSTFGYLLLIKIAIIGSLPFINFIYFFLFVNILFLIFLLENIKIKNAVVFFGFSAILNTILSLFLII